MLQTGESIGHPFVEHDATSQALFTHARPSAQGTALPSNPIAAQSSAEMQQTFGFLVEGQAVSTTTIAPIAPVVSP